MEVLVNVCSVFVQILIEGAVKEAVRLGSVRTDKPLGVLIKISLLLVSINSLILLLIKPELEVL